MNESPKVFDLLRGDAMETTSSAFGAVGLVHSGEGIEVVWVSKQAEQVDPSWFSTDTVDLLLVVQGRLRVEIDDARFADLTLGPGQLLVLPARTRCRAYRWPRDAEVATIFLAAFPKAQQEARDQAEESNGPSALGDRRPQSYRRTGCRRAALRQPRGGEQA